MGAEAKLTEQMKSNKSGRGPHLPTMPLLDSLAWQGPRRFRQLSPRAWVVLSQLPLTAAMVPVLAVAVGFHPELFRDPVFVVGILLHAVMLALCCALPWQHLPAWAVLAVPILDFVPIGFVRESVIAVMPAVGALAAFPVIWLAGSGIFPRFCMAMTFLGPLLMVWTPLLLAGNASGERLTAVILLPLIMGTIGFGIRTMSASMADQRRSLEDARDRLRESLAESARKERLLQTVVETVGVGVTALDRDGNTALSNQHQKRLSSRAVSPDSGVGGATNDGVRIFARGGTELLPPDAHPLRRAARGESFSEYLIWLGDGDRQRVFSTSAQAISADGHYDGSVITFSDVTHLIAAITAKDAFLSNISHELRTPLTSIMGYVDVLQEQTGLPAEAGEPLSVIARNAHRLHRLVSDLLSAASGSVDVVPEPADFADLIRQALVSVAPQAAAGGVELINDATRSLPAVIDPDRMAQVLDNLLSNAVKYSPDGGTVTVSARRTGPDVICDVSDTGIGMTETERAQVFTRFFRAESVRQAAIAGIGLGLAISKTIIGNHGGTISCSSTPGKGSTFTITFPVAGPATADAAPAEGQQSGLLPAGSTADTYGRTGP
jgi:signal transduction histidine kinase